MKIKNILKTLTTINGLWSIYNLIKFKCLGIKCTLKTFVYGKIYIKAIGDITIGRYFTYSSGRALNPLDRNVCGSIVAMKGAKILIGHNVSISSGCIWARESITIGNHCMIGSNVIIVDSDQHSIDYMERRNDTGTILTEPVSIDDDVWIGMSSIILKGVHIGKNTIIGAGSVVTKDIPSNCIAAGNPCKVIRFVNKQ